jgi:hypothetical protein
MSNPQEILNKIKEKVKNEEDDSIKDDWYSTSSEFSKGRESYRKEIIELFNE